MILYYLCTLIVLYPLSVAWTGVQYIIFNLLSIVFLSYLLNIPEEEEFFSYVEQDMIKANNSFNRLMRKEYTENNQDTQNTFFSMHNVTYGLSHNIDKQKIDSLELDYDTAEIINNGWFSRGLIKATYDNEATSTFTYIFVLGKWFREDSLNVIGLQKFGEFLENSINSGLSFIFRE